MGLLSVVDSPWQGKVSTDSTTRMHREWCPLILTLGLIGMLDIEPVDFCHSWENYPYSL